MKLACIFKIPVIAAVCCAAALAGTTLGSFVVTNDDVPAPFTSTATFYTVNADGSLGSKTTVPTGGSGIGGGYFAAARAIVMPNGSDACVYVSDAGSGDIAGIDAMTHTVTGNFFGFSSDSGASNGIGLAANAQYLYATYSASSTIATFQVQSGCTLTFVADIAAAGLNGGTADGMAIHGNIMVVTYGDGSIESFDIAGGVPIPNGDQQLSTGAGDDHLPNSVVITQDGHYAILGDSSTKTNVEVSDISSGRLTPTISYYLGPAWNSGSVQLSPDETFLFVANDSSGQVTAAYFDHTTGKVYKGCTSDTLKGFYTKYAYVGRVGFELATGAGGKIYVPEFGGGGKSFLGIVDLAGSGASCTLTESPNSPVANPGNDSFMLSIAAYAAAQ